MTTQLQKRFVICYKLINLYETKNCAGLSPVLNEISSSDEMIALSNVIDKRDGTFYTKLSAVVNNETSDNLTALYDLLMLV